MLLAPSFGRLVSQLEPTTEPSRAGILARFTNRAEPSLQFTEFLRAEPSLPTLAMRQGYAPGIVPQASVECFAFCKVAGPTSMGPLGPVFF